MIKHTSYREYTSHMNKRKRLLLNHYNFVDISKNQNNYLILNKHTKIEYGGAIIFQNNIINENKFLGYLPKKLYDSQMAYFQGDINLSEKLSLEILDKTKDIDIILGNYLILNTINMNKGNIKEYTKYRNLINDVVVNNKKDVFKKNILLTFIDTGMYINKMAYDWQEIDDFDSFPNSYINIINFIHVKCLLINKEMDKLLVLIEPLIINAHYTNNIVIEIYLRLIAVIVYNYLDEKNKADEQLVKAVQLGYKYNIISPFYEYRRDIGKKMNLVADKFDKEFSQKITKKYNDFIPKWIKLHNELTNRSVVNDLTDREYEVAKYAAAGYTNNQIAHLMNISINAVKLYISNVFTKTGVTKRTQIRDFI